MHFVEHVLCLPDLIEPIARATHNRPRIIAASNCAQHAERGAGWCPRMRAVGDADADQDQEEQVLYVFEIVTIDQ